MLYGTYTFIGKQIGKKGEWVGGEPRWLQLHIFIFLISNWVRQIEKDWYMSENIDDLRWRN